MPSRLAFAPGHGQLKAVRSKAMSAEPASERLLPSPTSPDIGKITMLCAKYNFEILEPLRGSYPIRLASGSGISRESSRTSKSDAPPPTPTPVNNRTSSEGGLLRRMGREGHGPWRTPAQHLRGDQRSPSVPRNNDVGDTFASWLLWR